MLTTHYSTVFRIRLIILFKLKYCFSLTKFVYFVHFFLVGINTSFWKFQSFLWFWVDCLVDYFIVESTLYTEKERALIIST